MSVDGSVPRRGSKLARVMSFRSLAGAGSDQKPFGQGSPLSWCVGVTGVGRELDRTSASFIIVNCAFTLYFIGDRSECVFVIRV